MVASTPVPHKSKALDAWSPATAFKPLYEDLQRSFDNVLNTWPEVFRQAAPLVKVDCVEDKDAIELTAELPGLTDKDVSVELSGNVLTISGVKAQEGERTDKGVTVSERSYGAFSRSIALPADIDASKISATVTDGVLKVVAPRKTSTPPRKIEVKAKS
jgi:HSP20 family protein